MACSLWLTAYGLQLALSSSKHKESNLKTAALFVYLIISYRSYSKLLFYDLVRLPVGGDYKISACRQTSE